MEFDFTKSSVLKEAARAIRKHNYIHSRAERNAFLITEYLSFAADLIDKLADGNVVIVRHGQWMYDETIGGMKYYYCTSCKERDPGNECYADENQIIWFTFCPKCGAKMNKE